MKRLLEQPHFQTIHKVESNVNDFIHYTIVVDAIKVLKQTASRKEAEEKQKRRRTRWGPIPTQCAEAAAAEMKKKKRKSRWEQPSEANESAIVAKSIFPKELTLPGGVRVKRPLHVL